MGVSPSVCQTFLAHVSAALTPWTSRNKALDPGKARPSSAPNRSLLLDASLLLPRHLMPLLLPDPRVEQAHVPAGMDLVVTSHHVPRLGVGPFQVTVHVLPRPPVTGLSPAGVDPEHHPRKWGRPNLPHVPHPQRDHHRQNEPHSGQGLQRLHLPGGESTSRVFPSMARTSSFKASIYRGNLSVT